MSGGGGGTIDAERDAGTEMGADASIPCPPKAGGAADVRSAMLPPAGGQAGGQAGGGARADAARRNLLLLVQLRWIAVAGQLVAIMLVQFGMGVRLPFAPMLAVLGGVIALNIAQLLAERHRPVSNLQLLVALSVDMAALGVLLYLSGGVTNPFVHLFLLQVVMGAVLLREWSSWLLVALSSAAVALLSAWYRPLDLPAELAVRSSAPFVTAAWFNFTLTAVLLVLFVTRIARNLRERDARLAAARQREAEGEHIVRIGLLASGAAHELGTPLASLSVSLGDWQHLPAIRADPVLAAEVADMRAEVARCKQVLSNILLAAGEVSGEAPERTTLRRFVRGIVDGWAGHTPLTLDDGIGEDRPIVVDRALAQAVNNLLDNAVEAGASTITLAVRLERGVLTLAVRDDGPGFAPALLDAIGKPYRSTKDRRGAGLGLFLANNVLRTLGGTMAARNLPGAGAEVTLTLPIEALALMEARR